MRHWIGLEYVLAGVWLAASQLLACAVWHLVITSIASRGKRLERRAERLRRLYEEARDRAAS